LVMRELGERGGEERIHVKRCVWLGLRFLR
jgi:hypothetical protein